MQNMVNNGDFFTQRWSCRAPGGLELAVSEVREDYASAADRRRERRDAERASATAHYSHSFRASRFPYQTKHELLL